MARNNLPHIILGSLGALTLGTGLGFGLGEYTTSGINPFYARAADAPIEVAQASEPAFAFATTAVDPTN